MAATMNLKEFVYLPKSSNILTLRIYTLAGSWDLSSIVSIVVPGSKGELSLLKNHTNYICRTDPGILKVRGLYKDFYYVLADFGILRLENNMVSIMVNTIENPYSYTQIQRFRDLLKGKADADVWLWPPLGPTPKLDNYPNNIDNYRIVISFYKRRADFTKKAEKRFFLAKVRVRAQKLLNR